MLSRFVSLSATAGFAVLATAAFGQGAVAQDYPDHPITIVVSASVGGSVDALTRQLAPFWEKELGQPIVVENKEGAGGVTGMRYFLEQPDDGYTIVVGTEAHFTATVEKSEGKIAPDALAIINMQQYTPTTWFVLESSKYDSFEQVIEEATANPDSITYGSPPTGNSVVTAGVVEKGWGVDLRYVPQEGGAETDTALLGGHIDIKIGTAGDVTEVEGMLPLAVASAERVKHLPDTPTFNEIGEKHGFIPMPNIGTGRIVATHASMREKHPEFFAKLAETYKAAFNNPEYQAALESTGQALSTQFSEPDAATEQFRQLVTDAVKFKAEYRVE